GAAVACAFFVVMSLGCLSIGGKTENVYRDDRSSAQSGKAALAAGQELDVYYPVAFSQTPNLELDEQPDRYVIIDQKPDHFRIRSNVAGTRTVSWTARGVPGGSPVSSTPSIVPTSYQTYSK